ncbi:MAG: hypothetical protein IPM32_09065 [Ignavibacteriae bacterium]|nr:hypothetical protein [Ignavibacteriota bacterium]
MNKVTQKEINTGGHVAGRDINIFNESEKRASYLCKLMQKFKKERDDNILVDKIIDELMHYKEAVDRNEIIGLNEKLKRGNREDLLEDALIMKEKFAKKLLKYELFESAQEIYATLLAHVNYNFKTFILPKIQENKLSKAEINQLIDSKVIQPLFDELDENYLRIYKDEINGMLYFLTGNCHIKWE